MSSRTACPAGGASELWGILRRGCQQRGWHHATNPSLWYNPTCSRSACHAGGASEQWGDKWTEEFGHGQGVKHGEVWSAGSNGERYNR
eukprot:1160720-Pelagomonas_calceolata.AAC.3